jgi:trk system potassium uptake protein TrkH
VRYTHLVHVVGIILIALGVALGFTALVAWFLGDGDAPAFILTALGSIAVGYVAYWRTELVRDLTVREGYAVVTLAWLAVGVVGAVPYLLTGTIGSPAAALFESISGFTTTGATVFADIESLPRGVVFWRAMTQWLGGMGIIVLGIAILPFLGVGGMQLFRAEVPGPTKERLAPRIRQTATLLWYVYGGLTAAEVILYLLGGMPVFEAVTHAFTTLSTGGFSARNASLAAYSSPYLQYVTILFMYMAGLNFTLHFQAVRGRPRYWKDPEWRFFTLVVLGATLTVLLLGITRVGLQSGFEPAVRDSLFQVVSISTTTGFVSTDYELWPVGSQLLLLLLMFMGGMAGSTAGGMKAMRVYLLTRQGLDELKRSLHPQAVLPTRLGKRPVRESTVMRILAFALFFIGLFAMGTFGMTLLGHDIVTSLGASAASIGNIGPGLGEVGAVDNYGWMGAPSHLLLIFLMLAGRLEIFTVLILFHPDLWRRYGRDPGPRLRRVADWTTSGHPLAPSRARDAERLQQRSPESTERSAEEEDARQEPMNRGKE